MAAAGAARREQPVRPGPRSPPKSAGPSEEKESGAEGVVAAMLAEHDIPVAGDVRDQASRPGGHRSLCLRELLRREECGEL